MITMEIIYFIDSSYYYVMKHNIHIGAQRKRWEASTRKRSGNLTTNEFLPSAIRQNLLEEDENLADKLRFESCSFPSAVPEIPDLDIVAGLQSMRKEGNITFYRAIRFPTMTRIWETLTEQGLSMANYEQERILEMYGQESYMADRDNIKADNRFWTQPQERVVDGVPLFSLVNDALQIHRAYRSNPDQVLVDVIQMPLSLVKKLGLIANTAIDLDCYDETRDYEITDFSEEDDFPTIDYSALRVRGIDVHEIYMKGLPFTLEGHDIVGIEQQFYLLDIHEINITSTPFAALKEDTQLLKKNEHFLHGFFGDQNIFGRQPTKYLPSACYQVTQK